jgi:hypothetical protein
MGPQDAPLLLWLPQVEEVPRSGEPAQHPVGASLDEDVPPNRQIHQSGGDIPHLDLVVHQGPGLRGAEVLRGLVLHRDGAPLRVSPLLPPPPEHKEEGQEGENDGPASPRQAAELRRGLGPRNGSGLPPHRHGQPFPGIEGPRGLEAHGAPGHIDPHVAPDGAGRPRVRCPLVGEHPFRKDDAGARLLDGDLPEVARDVPVHSSSGPSSLPSSKNRMTLERRYRRTTVRVASRASGTQTWKRRVMPSRVHDRSRYSRGSPASP